VRYLQIMEELTLNDQTVLFDRAATISAYKLLDHGNADSCTCGDCKNFAKFRSQVYRTDLLVLLERLGIDPLKEWEAYSFGDAIKGHIPYGGWFVFVGEWSPASTRRKILESGKQPESFSFTDSFPNVTEKFGSKVLAVQFLVEVPKAANHISNWG
jgi:hypothetical protein